jgi:UDP-glucuronate decarboxylase
MIQQNILYQEDLATVAEISLPWYKLKNKKILISGASGMIGSFIVDLFMLRNQMYGDNITIIALGRNVASAKKRFLPYWNSDLFVFMQHDINNTLPEIGKVDYIIHAASNTHPLAYASDPIGTITTNIIGTNNLLDYASRHEIKRFVFLSTVEIYGENRGDVEKFDESYCGYIDPNTLRAGYPESKRGGEALCNAFIQKYEMDIVIPRLCRVYGPTMLSSDSKAIAQFINKGVAKEDIVLKSKGDQYYSYCYVADAVTGILTILMCGTSGNAYNISDSLSDVTLKELAELIATLTGQKVVFRLPGHDESKGFSKATKALLDNTKLQNLGWRANHDIKTGLLRTIEILKNLEGGEKQ